jgi:hypothetical protein
MVGMWLVEMLYGQRKGGGLQKISVVRHWRKLPVLHPNAGVVCGNRLSLQRRDRACLTNISFALVGV